MKRLLGRRSWWWALVAVALGHGLLLHEAAVQLGVAASQPTIQRFDVTFNRPVMPVAHLPLPRQRPHARPGSYAPAVASPASASGLENRAAAQAGDEGGAPPVMDGPAVAVAASDANGSPTADTSQEAAPPALIDAASAPAFEWPQSTRLRYRLLGQFRGEVHGRATVEWLRQDERYQVHIEVSAGLVVSRSMRSQGHLSPLGLVPLRYEEETVNRLLPFSSPRLNVVRFEPHATVLADGVEVLPQEGVQDSASQFIQFIYLFSTQPDVVQPGRRISLPLALPRRLGPWVYEVGEPEPVPTPAGPLMAWPIQAVAGQRPGELRAQVWLAPQLQMLPVRFRMTQSDAVWFDLWLDELPAQAAR